MPGNPNGYVNPATGTMATVPLEFDDIGNPIPNPNNSDYPDMGALNPQRGRDWGLEFQWRF